MTHSPSATINPISSATGMNSVGDTMPRSGWLQRSSASQPRTSSRSRFSTGLVVEFEFAVIEGLAQRDFERAPLLHASVHVRFEEPVDAAAVRLGAIQRHVGILEELIGVLHLPASTISYCLT